MLKITIFENGTKRQVVLEGKLVAPWTKELNNVVQSAVADRDHLELVIDLRSVTAISADGEDVLLTLMDKGARFRASGVFMRQVLKNLTRRSRLTRETSERVKA
jgi:anti-anti-sigma regulatory factor